MICTMTITIEKIKKNMTTIRLVDAVVIQRLTFSKWKSKKQAMLLARVIQTRLAHKASAFPSDSRG
jgi:hypothetical protein